MAIWCHNYNVTDPMLQWTRSKQNEIIAFLRDMVECESPSDDPEGIKRFTEMFADRVCGLGNIKIYNGGKQGPHLQLHAELPGAKRVRSSRLAIPIRFIPKARSPTCRFAKRRGDCGARGCSI